MLNIYEVKETITKEAQSERYILVLVLHLL